MYGNNHDPTTTGVPVTVNPELERERQKATFDPELVTQILHGDLARRRFFEGVLADDKELDLANEPVYHFQSTTGKYTEAIRKTAIYIRIVKEHKATREEQLLLKDLMFPNEAAPTSLHTSMFTSTLLTQGSEEQKAKWMSKALNFEIIGTYVQTELGHGSNVRKLETTATYDPDTEEFVLHSPTITATKFWPGALGKTANCAVVMAGLYTRNNFHGVHPFLVQLRDLKTHEPLPGITLGDIGPKFDYNAMDNGFLRFDHVRIPRENMLMRNAKVQKDGSFVRTAHSDKLGYLMMLQTRVNIIRNAAAQSLAQAVTIAVRYSCVRHQSELKPGAEEPQIIEHQMQQYKLFPLLATAYAYWIAGTKLRTAYIEIEADILEGQTDALRELHATSAGLKAFSTFGMMHGIEQCRLACGGHGYSQASGLPKIYANMVAACTYEGENTVLLLQTARFLTKNYREASRRDRVPGKRDYFLDNLDTKSTLDTSLSIDSLVSAYRHRAARLVVKASKKLIEMEANGVPHYEAWNKTSIFLVKAAEAHCHFVVISDFADSLSPSKCRGSEPVSAVFTDLFKLYAVHGIWTNVADFIENGYMSAGQLNIVEDAVVQLLERIRPNAVALVDAFSFSDRQLGSVLGRYDGQVYENLYKWALSSPLNKTQVHESQRYLAHLRSHSKL